jgi:membrane protein YqaA with SNARE-associated domain
MLQRLYDWTMGLAGHRHAMAALAAVAFAESSVFPVPPDVLIIPMVLAARERWLAVALTATAASVLGGLAGYGIGYFLLESVGRAIIDFYHLEAGFARFQALYQEWGAWIVAAAGFTPLPYKVFTIASGAADLNLVTFTVASALSRGARFFLVAALLWRFGPPIRRFVEANLAWLAAAAFGLLVAGFVVVRYVV